MTTLFDLNILEGVAIVLAMLLLFVLFYGFLKKTEPLGEGKDGIYSLIAIAITILALTTQIIRDMIMFMAPWFAVIIFVAFFILFIMMIFGVKGDALAGDHGNILKGGVIVLALVVFLFALVGNTSFPSSSDDDEDTEWPSYLTDARDIIVHPQVLGFITLMLVAAVTVILITKKA